MILSGSPRASKWAGGGCAVCENWFEVWHPKVTNVVPNRLIIATWLHYYQYKHRQHVEILRLLRHVERLAFLAHLNPLSVLLKSLCSAAVCSSIESKKNIGSSSKLIGCPGVRDTSTDCMFYAVALEDQCITAYMMVDEWSCDQMITIGTTHYVLLL